MTYLPTKRHSILMAMTVLFAVTITPAFATENCSDGSFCFGTEELHSTGSFDQSGIKATVDIPNMVTDVDCDPSGNGFAVVSVWTFLPDGDYIEIGVASGQIDGSCYDSEEHHYLVYWQTGYNEFKLSGSVSPGDSDTFQISDTNNDDTWQAYTDGNQRASLIMNYDYTNEALVGLESRGEGVDVPQTDITNVSEHDGTDWDYWTTEDGIQDIGEGWIEQCTPNYKNISVGVGGTESC